MTNTDLAASLDAALDTHESVPGFLVDNLEKAEWAARKRAQYQAKVDEVTAIATDRIERVNAWAQDATQADRDSVEHFDGLLKFYHQTEINNAVREGVKDAKLPKSIKLPGITLASRKAPDDWKVDEPVAIAWAKAHAPDLVKTVESFKLADAKKALDVAEDGTVTLPVDGGEPLEVDGIEVTVKPRSYRVDVK